MNKKRRTFLIIVGIILFAVFILYAGFSKPFTFYLPHGMQHFQYSLIQETPEYYYYHLSWDSTQPETSTCENQELITPFSFGTSHNILSAPETLYGIYGDPSAHIFETGDSPYLPFIGNPYGLISVPKAVKFTSTDVTLNGVQAIATCNTNPVSVPFIYIDKQIECEMQPPQSTFREDASGYIFCTWSGHVKANDGTSTLIVRGLSSGSANIKMYKTGFSAPEVITAFYRLSNNQCTSISILPSQKTSIDYSTLSDCTRAAESINLQTINFLNLSLSQQIALINQLNVSIQQKAAIILNMTTNINQQTIIIQGLQLTQSQQAQLIGNLTSQINQQAVLINSLTTNLQSKALLVSQLQITNENQAQLISQMKLSFSDQAGIIDALNKNITSDAIIINNLNLNLDGQAQIISNLKLTNQQQAQLIGSLTSKIDEQAQLISSLNLQASGDAILIKNLNLSLQDNVELISRLNLNLNEETQIASQLAANSTDKDKIISDIQVEKDKLQSDLQTKNIILILIGVIAFIAILIFIYIKTRRR